jgi:uncharacterized membrane protein YkvA (DUF1232 family)
MAGPARHLKSPHSLPISWRVLRNNAMSDEQEVKQKFWPKLQANLARLPFAEEVVAAWYCAFDTATPIKVRGTLLAALAYFILPIDVIPDFIVGLGFTDDLAVLMTALTLVKNHVTQAHRDRAKETVERLRTSGAPKDFAA